MTRIKANQFEIERIDLATFDYPKVKVRTWSNLSSPGGSVTLEVGEGMQRITLASIPVECDGSVRAQREELQELADEFNKDAHASWDTLVGEALTKNEAFYASELVKRTADLAAVRAKIEQFAALQSAQADA